MKRKINVQKALSFRHAVGELQTMGDTRCAIGAVIGGIIDTPIYTYKMLVSPLGALTPIPHLTDEAAEIIDEMLENGIPLASIAKSNDHNFTTNQERDLIRRRLIDTLVATGKYETECELSKELSDKKVSICNV